MQVGVQDSKETSSKGLKPYEFKDCSTTLGKQSHDLEPTELHKLQRI